MVLRRGGAVLRFTDRVGDGRAAAQQPSEDYAIGNSFPCGAGKCSWYASAPRA